MSSYLVPDAARCRELAVSSNRKCSSDLVVERAGCEKGGAELGPRPGPGAGSRTGAEPGAWTGAEAGPRPGAGTGPAAVADAGAKRGAGAGQGVRIAPGADAVPGLRTEAGVKADADAEAGAGARAGADIAAGAGAAAATDARPWATPEGRVPPTNQGIVSAAGQSQKSEARSQKAEVRKRRNENDLAATMTKDLLRGFTCCGRGFSSIGEWIILGVSNQQHTYYMW